MNNDEKCDICGKLFCSEKQLQQHKQHLHVLHPKITKLPRSNMRSVLIGVVISLIVADIGLGLATAQQKSPSAAPTSLAVDGIRCSANEQFLFHIHTHLDIFVNGQLMYVPPQIGIIPDKCIYWLHTHDETGIIHIESPVKGDFALGQFFDLWKTKLNNSQGFDNIFNGKDVPTVYINGSKVPSGINYRDIKLHAHDEIALVYGRPPQPDSIPSTYNFPQGL
ncbi:MAG TPA: hypothetical protein VI278_13040 [Nitrososphaeraceae archaeon]